MTGLKAPPIVKLVKNKHEKLKVKTPKSVLSLFLCGFRQLMVVRYDDTSTILKAFLIILYLLS